MKEHRLKAIYTDPIKMALVVCGLLIFCQVLFLLLTPLLTELIDESSPWVVSVAMMLFFVLTNSVSTFIADNLSWNWGRSVYGFIILGAVGYLLAWVISGKSIGELDGLRDLVMIAVIGFLVLKSIATTIMIIMLFIQKRDAQKE